MTCTDCHDPHAQHYRDDRWRQLDGRTDDRQCTSCHPSKQDNTPAHTFHQSGSPGSRCVACHMPYLQHPAVGDRVPYRRSDHTISIPRPDADDQFGIKTACATCHTKETPDALARQVRAWWGELKPRHPLVEAVIRSSDARTPAQGTVLLRPDLDAPMLQFAALTQYFLRFIAVDAGITPESADRAIRDLAEESSSMTSPPSR